MPLVKNAIFRRAIIDELLGRKEWVKTKEICILVKDRLRETVSAHTIQNDIRDLRDDTRLQYFAPIEYDNKQKAYRYTDRNYSIKNFGLHEHELNAFRFYAECLKMFSGYSLFQDFTSGVNKIMQGVSMRRKVKSDSIPRRIIQTDSLVVAKGNEYLEEVVFAIDNEYKLNLEYQSFEKPKAKKRIVYPFFVKEYKNRWYLIAVSEEEARIKIYSFDRIQSISTIEKKFQSPVTFDPDTFFQHAFGITASDGDVELIVLRFDSKEMPYIRSLPIHPSQTIVKETSKFTDVEIKVFITYELKEFILSKTPSIEVLSPKKLRDEIIQSLKKVLKKYS
jgi:predicted DNA-binding transcriptional regulator YafY